MSFTETAKAIRSACKAIGTLYKDDEPDKPLPLISDLDRITSLIGPMTESVPVLGKIVAVTNAVTGCAVALTPDRVARWNRRLKDLDLEGFGAPDKAAEYVLEDLTMEIAGFNRDLPVIHNAFMILSGGETHLYPDGAEHDNPNKPQGSKKWVTRQLQPSRNDAWLINRDGAIYTLRKQRWQAAALLAIVFSASGQAVKQFVAAAEEYAGINLQGE